MKEFKRTSRSQSACNAPLSVFVDIPATFTEAQAETILAIAKISPIHSRLAEQLLQAWSPKRFTDAQARCIQEILQLDAGDLRATIADAVEPCELRRRLFLRPEGEPTAEIEVWAA